MNFVVIENRGAGIKYEVFHGTLEDCELWIREQMELPFEERMNGNGEEWDYTIQEVVE